MGVIIFNGIPSTNYGIHVETPPVYATPERDYEVVHIPGRNGDLVIDNGSYKNVTRKYSISVGEIDGNFTTLAAGVSEWLHSASGYTRLEDSYESDYFRLAYYVADAEMENLFHQAGKMLIEFNCKPARFLKAGERAVSFTTDGSISNPTFHKSFPKLTVVVSGSGTLTIGDQTITISGLTNSTRMVIDSELQDVYEEGSLTNLNSKVSFSDGFPILSPGVNTIAFTGSITSVEVIPRWWIL